jgi:hypothetical protein
MRALSEGPMASDPQECHANALQCMGLAAEVKYPKLRATFLKLANMWTKLAIELEKPRKPRRRRGGPEHLRWFWALHFPSKPESLRTDNRVATLEAAKAEFEASWRQWLA